MTCGIYKIVNILNNKFYIGSSKNIESRWKQHKRDLKRGGHHSIHLQRAWNMYGENNFKLIIFQKCKERLLIEVEQSLLDDLKPWKDSVGYNVSPKASGGDILSTHPNKIKIIENISRSVNLNIKNLSEDERKRKWSKPLEKNPNWKGGKSYFKCPICKKVIKRHNDSQLSCADCRNRCMDKNPFYGKKHTEETKRKIRESHIKLGNSRNIQKIQVEIDGVIYSSFSEAAKAVGCAIASIRNRLNNPSKFPNYKLIKQL